MTDYKFKTHKELQENLEEGLELEVGDSVEVEGFESEKDGFGVTYVVTEGPENDAN